MRKTLKKTALTLGIVFAALACWSTKNAQAQVVTTSSYYGVSYGSPIVVGRVSPVIGPSYVSPVIGPRIVTTRVIGPRVFAPRVVAPLVVRPRVVAPIARTTRAAAVGVRAVVRRPFVRRFGF